MVLLGSIAISTAGRDKDKMFIIVGVLDKEHVLIANGKSRKIEKPKRKKLKHLRAVGECDLAKEMLNDKKLTNKTAAKIIASYHIVP